MVLVMDINSHISILDFNQTTLKDCFQSDDCILQRKFTTPYDYHLLYIESYLAQQDCKTIILEKEYTDRDYLIDYSSYYARCHNEYKRKCRRIHFFDKNFLKEEVAKLILGEPSKITWDDLQNSYLGCIVAKPLPEIIIGKTLLKPFENNDERKITCIRDYKTHLSNFEFHIKTLAFQEQDTVCAACATSSLWSAFHQAASIYPQITALPPVEITKRATKYFFGTRPFPSSGLTVWQMCQAIHEIGLDPHVSGGSESDENLLEIPIKSLIYSFLRAEIPVILNAFITSPRGDMGLHSMLILGYKLNKNKLYTKEAIDESCLMRGSRITDFYCHDDQLGPFCKIKSIGPMQVGSRLRGNRTEIPVVFKNPLKNQNEDFWNLIIPSTIIVPLYEKIRVVFFPVYENVQKINRWLTAYNIVKQKDIEWDIYLIKSDKYKENITNDPNYKPYLKNILTRALPRYIWICNANYKGIELFELIIDATDMERSFYFLDVLFFHDTFKAEIHRISTDQQSRDRYSILLTEKFLDLLAQTSR
jgi:hypothetical protein